MPRIPGSGDNFVGKVCVCSLGRVGIVAEFKEIRFPNGDQAAMWCGMGFDGKGLWASRDPIVLAESLTEYTNRVLSKPSNVLYGTISVPPPKKESKNAVDPVALAIPPKP